MNRTEWLNHLRQLDKTEIDKEARDKIDELIDEELKEQEEAAMEQAGVEKAPTVVTVNLDAVSNYFQDTLWNIGQVHALDRVDGRKPFYPVVKLDDKFMRDFIDLVYHIGVEADDDGNFIQWP